MKKALSFLLVLCLSYCIKAQHSQNDSLAGFDFSAAVTRAHQKNLAKNEIEIYLNRAKRWYINEKFKLQQIQIQSSPSKFYPSNVNNTSCFNEDFELFALGTLTTNYVWTASQCYTCSPICNTSSISMSANSTSAVVIYSTPVTDLICGTVGNSPFGGNKVAKINNIGNQIGRIQHTFPVVPSLNPILMYAYKGVLAEPYHNSCCDDAYLMFRFYSVPSGSLISSLSQTIMMGTQTCVPTSTLNWAVSTATTGYFYTPNWQVVALNLSAFTGSTLTMEVIGATCTFGGHSGYMYFDAMCSDGYGIIANGTSFLGTTDNSYISCVSTATLAGLPGLSSYLWQGPSSSSVTGFTSSVITTSVSGNYTLVTTSGTVTNTQTLNLSFDQSTLSIVGNTPICPGQTASLQVSSSGINSYLWNTGSMSPSIAVSPSTTTTYSIITTNTNNCNRTSAVTLTILPNPTISIQTNSSAICLGQSATLNALTSGIATYTWSNSTNNPIMSVSPTVTTVYTISGTTYSACLSPTSSQTITVYPLPQLQINSSSQSLCVGESATLSVTGTTGNTYNWLFFGPSFSISVSPTITSNFYVTATSSLNCKDSTFQSITVYSLPQVQIVPNLSAICIGQSSSLTATGLAGNSYTWSNGSTSYSTIVTPTLSSAFNVAATDLNGCKNSTSQVITVYPLPQIQLIASATTICAGENTNIGITGNNISTVLWNTGATGISISVSPSLNTVYSTTVSSSFGCVSSQSVSVSVNPLPQAQIVASSPSICLGESAILTISGSNLVSYNWSTNNITSSVSVSPLVTTDYTVNYTNSFGCSSYSTFHLLVEDCSELFTGINKNIKEEQKLIIFPNPSSGSFSIRAIKNTKAWLVNDIGQIIAEFNLNAENNYTYTVNTLAKGMYFVKSKYGAEKVIVK